MCIYSFISNKTNKKGNLYMPIILNIYDKPWSLLKYMKNSMGIQQGSNKATLIKFFPPIQ